MSLLVWLPLNGNLNNLGLSPAKFSMVNSSSGLSAATAGGKTSAGMYQRTTRNTADYITSDINFTLDGDFSMCCWCKITDYGNSNSANGIITNHGHTTGGSGITMRYISASDYRMSINTGTDSSNRTYCTHYGTTNIYNAWHHLCVTYDRANSQYIGYVDGKQDFTATFRDTAVARPFCLFAWSTDYLSSANYRPPCQLNDVRLYDHCLSQKEVSDIAKGLIAHYPLRDRYIEATTNIAPYPTPGSSATASYGWDQTLHTNAISVSGWSVGYNSGVGSPTSGYHAHWELIDNIPTMVFPNLNSTISLTNRWLGISSSDMRSYFGANKTYTISADVKASNPGMKVCTGLYYYVGTTRNFHDGLTQKQVSTEWTRMSWTYTTSANYTANTAYIYFYGHYGAEGIAYIKNIQVEFNDHATPYISSSQSASNKVIDCSGFSNNGTWIGSPTVIENTTGGRNSYVTKFNGSNIAAACGRGPMVTDEITVNIWAYKDNWTTATDAERFISCTENGGWNFEYRNSFICYANAGYRSAVSSVLWSTLSSGWHMFTGVWDGYQAHFYIDGNLRASSTALTAKYPITYNASNGIFIGAEAGSNATTPASGYYSGRLSDARIYCVALSSDEILNLYKSSASIDNNQNLYSYEFNETDKNNIGKNGTTNFASISSSANTYDMKTKILSDGSVWARVHWLDVTNKKTWFANAAEVAKCLNQPNRYSRMGQIENFIGSNGSYEFMLTYPSLSSTLYNRWKQTSSPNAATVTGYTPITIAWSAHSAGIRKNGSACLYNCDSGSTWYAPIGQYSPWTTDKYIPAADGSSQTSTELWVRIDTIASATECQIYDKSIIANDFYEI